LISMGSGNSTIFSYLFGSIALVSFQDVIVVMILSIFILLSILFLYRGLFYISFDEEAANLAGVPVKGLNLYFNILMAVTIAVSMRIVGILLVSSLMVVPVATALHVARSFKGLWLYSILFGLFSVLIGLIVSFYGDFAPGGTIVLASVIMLIICIGVEDIKGINKRVVKKQV